MTLQGTKTNRRDRLLKLLVDHSQHEISSRTGISVAYLYQMTKGKGSQQRWCSDANARLIETSMGLPRGWLDRVELEGTATPTQTAMDVMRRSVARSETPQDYVRLPRYDAEVSAGAGALIDDSGADVVQLLDVARWWAEKHLPRDLSRVRVLGVRGDSMSPDLQDGDLCFVDTSKTWDGPGVYVMNWNGSALVKRLVPEIKTGRLAIVSVNPAYPTEHVEPGELESLHIGGKVIAAWTLKRM